MKRTMGKSAVLAFIHLYEGTASSEVRIQDMAAFIQEDVPTSVTDVRVDFLRYWLGRRADEEEKVHSIAVKIARARVKRPDKHDLKQEPLTVEVGFERRFLREGAGKPAGILYDGHQLITIYAGLISPDEANSEHCHIVLTNQLFGTWDENDRRYHARVSVYGFPSLLSTAGLVEGPARPRESYLRRLLGADRFELEKEFDERYLTRDDPRLQEALKGYILQALFYHVTGNPFCEDRDCRLFNAHWQEDLIHAQTRPEADLCDRHRRLLKECSCK